MRTLIADRILVVMDSVDNKTESGIILPEQKDKKSDYGTVIMVGQEVSFLQKGSKIKKFSEVKGVPYEHEGKNCLILREKSDIEFIV